MNITSITIALPVTDLESACLWYGAVLERTEPDLEPVIGTAEYEVGGVWLQLVETTEPRTGDIAVRLGVDDVWAEHIRIGALGIDVGTINTVDGATASFSIGDPDGNSLDLYSLIDETGRNGSDHGSDTGHAPEAG